MKKKFKPIEALSGEDQQKLFQVAQEAQEESEKLYEEGGGDLLDLDIPVAVPVFDGLHSIRNANIKNEKLYLDKEIRYSYLNKEEGNSRNEATIYLNPDDNKLSEIITQLPYGLIDKQATGIGATYSEMHSERDSIIVVPTRALGENKCRNNPLFLYVGTKKDSNRVTTNEEIKNYLNDSNIAFKKIVVVADSLKKVIDNIEVLGIDVYRDYFLMIDEIDTIQSDNHYRPQLSNVIDYYRKFKLQRRALVSATVKEFSDPKLDTEPVTIIRRKEPTKRNIDLLYTNNINKLLTEEIIRISIENPTDKILIAYNSITDIQIVISYLSEDLRNRCGILCSEASHDDRIEQRHIAEINSEDELSHDIVFMTCAYFAGLDIKDRCHLITISNIQYNYTIQPTNRMTQIAGRCRNGLLSDTIIYNIMNKPIRYLTGYKKYLIHKAQKMVDYFNATEKVSQGDDDLKIVFERIKPVIIEKSYEEVFRGKPIPLTRENLLSHDFEISYFNIDVLYEQMYSYSMLYSNKNSLYNALMEDHNVVLQEKIYDEITQERTKYISNEIKRQRIQRCIDELIAEILTIETSMFNRNQILKGILETKVRQARTFEKESYYKRVKELYKYVDINILNQKLLDICIRNVVPYNNFKNAIFFWALDDNHMFKQLIKSNFIIEENYSNEEIQQKLLIILNNQSFRKSSITDESAVQFLNSIIECQRQNTRNNIYKIMNYTSKILTNLGVASPLSTISAGEEANRYFKL